MNRADRVVPVRRHCAGPQPPREGIEPMAARIEPGRVHTAHQPSHHLVAKANRFDAVVLAVVRFRVLPAIARNGPI